MRWPGTRTRVVIEPSVPIFQSDARRHDGPRRRGPSSDEGPESSARMRRRVRMLAWYVILGAGALAALVGQGGYIDLVRYRSELADARMRLEQQRRVVEQERQAIERLRVDPLAKERIAREQLGLAPEGEIQFLLPRDTAGDEPPSTAPGTDRAPGPGDGEP